MKGMRYESADVDAVARYVADDAWSMEQKADGIRCIVRTDLDGVASFYTHTGELLKSGVRHFPKIASALSVLKGCTVDGELLDSGRLWLFDVMEVLGTDTRLLSQSARRDLLDTMQPALGGTVVSVLPQAVTATEKAALWAAVLAESAEGVVVKRRAASYSVGAKHSRTGDVLKLKVTRTIDVVVTGRNTKGHLNAELGLYDDSGRLVHVGGCSMIGKTSVEIGDVIEVTFLYVVDPTAPRLYQARMMRPRTDRTADSCSIDQLKGCFVSKAVLAG